MSLTDIINTIRVE